MGKDVCSAPPDGLDVVGGLTRCIVLMESSPVMV